MAKQSRLLRLLCGMFMTAVLLAGGNTIAIAAPAGNLSDTCKEVEVNGYRAMPYSCLGQAMTPPARPAQPNPAMAASDISKQQPNNIGLYSQSALRNRMGNALGKSVKPQRPPRSQP